MPRVLSSTHRPTVPSRGQLRPRLGPWILIAAVAACSVVASRLHAQSTLADAAERRDHATVRALLQARAEVHASQGDGMTALHWAVYHDDLDLARDLIAAGAAAAATNRYGVPPLALACRHGQAALAELLLLHGADPNLTLRGGETPLMTAARTGNPGVIRALIRYGANPNARERHGQTALMWAAAEGHTEAVRTLLRAGADPEATLPDSGFNAFFFAAREGHAGVLQELLRSGQDLHAAMNPRKPTGKGPRKGTSALILAVENGHFELALDLVRAGADPNDQRSGHTPLHVMTWVRKPPRGEDEGDPPPRGSGRLNSLEFIRELVKAGADVNARLVQGRGGPGRFSTEGVTPLFMAAATADLDFIELLVELGADPSIPNVEGCTPLMAACGIGVGSAAANEVAGEEPEVLEVVGYLMRHGADLNVVDANGETAMHGAAYKNLPRVIQFLAEHGARLEVWNAPNRYGWTPLQIAEGYRPGNFKPSAETVTALHGVMRAAGVIPPVTARPEDLNNSDWTRRLNRPGGQNTPGQRPSSAAPRP